MVLSFEFESWCLSKSQKPMDMLVIPRDSIYLSLIFLHVQSPLHWEIHGDGVTISKPEVLCLF